MEKGKPAHLKFSCFYLKFEQEQTLVSHKDKYKLNLKVRNVSQHEVIK